MITKQQAARLLLQRQQARDTLTAFARYVDIPGVPLDEQPAESDDDYAVVETELARHHVLMCDALQSMVDGTLRYDPDTMAQVIDSEAISSPELAQPPTGDRFDGGGAEERVHAPSRNSTIPQNLCKSEISEKYTGDISKISQKNYTKNYTEASICRRVMFLLPPGSAKSTYGSVVFPVWEMGRHPNQEIILTGYGDVITKRHGKRARQLTASKGFQSLWGGGLDPKTKAADDWAMENGSTYKSAGILSGITGFRADGLIWDDLTKGRKEADSVTIRNDTYNAYLDDARSRKKPNAWEVGIGTRWHEDEIMGRILPEGYKGESGFMECRDGNVWFVMCMAAECERADDPLGREIGEMIWPEWFGEDYWRDKRMNARSWASLYQQRPAPEDGLYFKKEMFRRYRHEHKGNRYICFDPAVTGAEEINQADETAIIVVDVDDTGKIQVIDEWVRQCTMDVWIEQLITLIRIHKPMACVSEAGVIRRASEPFIKRAMINTGVFAVFEYVTRHADKMAMARSIQALYASGMVWHPDNQVGDNIEDELLRFPTAKDDHRVDALANLGLYLENLWASQPIKKVEEKSIIIDDTYSIQKLMPKKARKKSQWAFRK